jgi:hypothetical protein
MEDIVLSKWDPTHMYVVRNETESFEYGVLVSALWTPPYDHCVLDMSLNLESKATNNLTTSITNINSSDLLTLFFSQRLPTLQSPNTWWLRRCLPAPIVHYVAARGDTCMAKSAKPVVGKISQRMCSHPKPPQMQSHDRNSKKWVDGHTSLSCDIIPERDTIVYSP